MNYRYLQDGTQAVIDPDGVDPDAPNAPDEMEQQVQEANLPAGPMPYLDQSNLPAYVPRANNAVVEPAVAPVEPPASGTFKSMPAWQGPDTNPYTGALGRLETQVEKYPEKTPPKWWQRAAAAGLGAAAGWSNAASRTRNPINIQQTGENILYPGYESKLAQWQSKVVPLQQEAQIESEKIGAQYGGIKAQSEAQLKAAQAQAAMQHGQYWANRSLQERQQWKIDPKTGTLFNTVTGQVTQKAQTPKDRYDIAVALGATPQEARFYGFNGKLPNPPAARNPPAASNPLLAIRAAGGQTGNPQIDALDPKDAAHAIDLGKDRAPKDPFVDWMRQQQFNETQQKNLEAIGNSKNSAVREITGKRQAEIERVFGPGTTEQDIWADNATFPTGQDSPRVKQLKAINRQFAPEMQGSMDAFSSAGRAHGLPAQDFVINPDTFEAKPRVSGSPMVVAPAKVGPGQGTPQAPPAHLPAGAPLRAKNAANDTIELRNGQWVLLPRQ